MAKRPGNFLLQGVAGSVGIQLKAAAHQVAGVQEAQREDRIRKRRVFTAAAITDRAGQGAGTLRTDFQKPAAVQRDDAAATCADLGNIDHEV